ncbi:MAG: glycosyltransferase family 39 protein [Anaerolineaceae bacterium]|nr:glycosyltransferase family 39 protein [Anaerolineaceae bacterium]
MVKSQGVFQKASTSPGRGLGLLMLAFTAGYFAAGAATLPAYGMTWDEGLGNFFFGERYLFYLTTFNGKYLDFKADLASLAGYPLHLFLSPLREFPHEFPAFFDTLSAGAMHWLGYRLQWLDPVDAFHLPTVLAAALLLLALHRFAAPRLGRTAAWGGVLLLAFTPRFWADMHFNVKDIPETVFFSLALVSFAGCLERPGAWRALRTGLAFGAAIAIKANGWFIPVVLFLSLLPWNFCREDWLSLARHFLRRAGDYALMAVSGAGVLLLSWPYLYEDPLRIRNYANYILSQGGRSNLAAWSWQPVRMVSAVLPEILLIFLLGGIGIVVYRAVTRRSFVHRMLLFWCLLPVVRISLPGMVNFDGIRHFLEFLPAACLLAGVAIQALIERTGRASSLWRWGTAAALAGWLAITTLLAWRNYGPYQHVYFNSLWGGLPNAAGQFGQAEATDYWGATYRQGMGWLDENAAQGAGVYVPAARWLVELPTPLWLRDDLRLLPEDETPALNGDAAPVYVMYVTRPESSNEVTQYCERNLKPVYQIEAQGVALLKIYRLDGEAAWQPLS